MNWWQRSLVLLSNKTNSKIVKRILLWWERSGARGERHAKEFIATNPAVDVFRMVYLIICVGGINGTLCSS